MLVRIENLTQKTTIMRNGKIADNPWSRLQDLIGTPQLEQGDGLLIIPYKSVRRIFMSVAVDLLYINEADQVVGLDERILPSSIRKPRRDCSYMIEVPVGTIALNQTNIGNLLQVIYQGSTRSALHNQMKQ